MIHVLSGVQDVWGERLQHHAIVGVGDFCTIAPDVPHLPYTRSESEPVIAIIARTDADERESIVPLPELTAGVDWAGRS